jgi:glycosyltransferase involved in cell wall biosynthesis
MKNLIKNFPSNLLCFSHLRWDFVYQRPQHLLSRFAQYVNVYFLEEPIFDATDAGSLTFTNRGKNIIVGQPHLPAGLNPQEVNALMTDLLDQFLQTKNLDDFAFWYYSPMPLSFSEKHLPKITIYDCMDELSAFKNAPKELTLLEKKLMGKADLVFTGGHSLYEAKQKQHSNIYPFPSSIEKEHFLEARTNKTQPADQKDISGIKLGFYGVIDERFDIDLIKGIADARPDWQIILIGPVVKIDPATLPKNPNIHYMGQKSYQELPGYLSGWDIALIPFAINESTKFISPTKTPEYLSAGIPVVSTPIKDVIRPYGNLNLVSIGVTAEDFVEAIDQELSKTDRTKWLAKTDAFLANISWDKTVDDMLQLMKKHLNSNFSIAS